MPTAIYKTLSATTANLRITYTEPVRDVNNVLLTILDRTIIDVTYDNGVTFQHLATVAANLTGGTARVVQLYGVKKPFGATTAVIRFRAMDQVGGFTPNLLIVAIPPVTFIFPPRAVT